MSNADQHGSAVNSSSGQVNNVAAAAAIPKKKRHHSNASAAIAARRAGHLGQGVTNGEDDSLGAPFISSSRDASEVRKRNRRDTVWLLFSLL
jgi:hypothetical protein